MKKRPERFLLATLAFLLYSSLSYAQPEDLTQVWPAQWIAPADAPPMPNEVASIR